MRTFAYRHWDSELVLVGDWAQGERSEARLRALHDTLWSDAPPGLRSDADVGALMALGELDHPLARALFLMYHARALGFARRGVAWLPAIAERLRVAARRVLQESPIAHVEKKEVARLLEQAVVRPRAGAYVRWTALAVLRELARAADGELLAARLAPPDAAGNAPDSAAASAGVDERVEAVWALAALVAREPALLSSMQVEERLLALIREDLDVAVRIAALQALMTCSPSAQCCAALRAIAQPDAGVAPELGWAATIALFAQEPAASAALVLAVYRRAMRPAGFSALFTQLELAAEDAALHVALSRCGGTTPLIWRDPDCTVFALCQADGSAPPGAADPALPEIVAQWMTATPLARAALLSRLAGCEHAAGRALAVLAGLQEDSSDPTAEYEEEEDAEGRITESLAASAPDVAVRWVALARRVLADPPLTRLSAAAGRTLVERSINSDSEAAIEATVRKTLPAEIGEPAANHGAAIALLGRLGELADGDILVQSLLQAAPPRRSALQVTTLEALYLHSRRYGQPSTAAPLLATVTALARDGVGEARQRAVQLLGCFPPAVTQALLRELTHDPTNTVCCLAERALAEQEWSFPPAT